VLYSFGEVIFAGYICLNRKYIAEFLEIGQRQCEVLFSMAPEEAYQYIIGWLNRNTDSFFCGLLENLETSSDNIDFGSVFFQCFGHHQTDSYRG
jgi:hypothetical protein